MQALKSENKITIILRASFFTSRKLLQNQPQILGYKKNNLMAVCETQNLGQFTGVNKMLKCIFSCCLYEYMLE